MVDAEYKFLWADVSARGAASDAQIFNASELKACIEDNRIGFPAPRPLPNDTQDVPYFIVGDDAFGLRTTLMKPYSRRGMDPQKHIFNYRLSRARRVVENAFGILSNRFQVLLTTMQHKPDTLRLILTSCLLLHNLMRIRYPVLQNNLVDREQNRHQIPGAWRQRRDLLDTRVVEAPNRASKDGKLQHNLIKHWCKSEAGSVQWQNRLVCK